MGGVGCVLLALLALGVFIHVEAAGRRPQPQPPALQIFVSAPVPAAGAAQHTRASTEGRHADGSLERPFRTLHAARDAMRAGLGRGRRRVVLIEGEHYMAEPLVLDSRDSGTADAPVAWRSRWASAPARLIGGTKLPVRAFHPTTVPSGATGVVKANLFSLGFQRGSIPGMSWPYANGAMELFVDGRPMTRARSPNIGDDGTWVWAGYSNVTSVSDSPYMSFNLLDREAGALWAPAVARGELWLHGFFRYDWRDTFIKVDKLLPMPNASGGWNVTRDVTTPPQMGFAPGFRFYAVDALELLDGAWAAAK